MAAVTATAGTKTLIAKIRAHVREDAPAVVAAFEDRHGLVHVVCAPLWWALIVPADHATRLAGCALFEMALFEPSGRERREVATCEWDVITWLSQMWRPLRGAEALRRAIAVNHEEKHA